jgi:hypothetical protein
MPSNQLVELLMQATSRHSDILIPALSIPNGRTPTPLKGRRNTRGVPTPQPTPRPSSAATQYSSIAVAAHSTLQAEQNTRDPTPMSPQYPRPGNGFMARLRPDNDPDVQDWLAADGMDDGRAFTGIVFQSPERQSDERLQSPEWQPADDWLNNAGQDNAIEVASSTIEVTTTS